MAIFLTGSTGYIGAHVAANLLQGYGASLNVLVRARDPQEAQLRLWRALQLHLPFPAFFEYLQTKMRIFCGDLTATGFGLGRDEYDRLVHTTDSIIHCAASLNRKSEKSCLNVNLRGTLEVLTLARNAEHYHGLRRFSKVSTVAVAGKRRNEVVTGGVFRGYLMDTYSARKTGRQTTGSASRGVAGSPSPAVRLSPKARISGTRAVTGDGSVSSSNPASPITVAFIILDWAAAPGPSTARGT